MSYLPPSELRPDDGGKKGPSFNRIVLWIIVAGVGLYLVGSGLYGALTP